MLTRFFLLRRSAVKTLHNRIEVTRLQLLHGDCLELMQTIPDKSVDLILCDLPYGTTACKWDVVIPFEPLWAQYKRIVKDRAAIVLTASQPFTSALVMSNVQWFKHEWIWEKECGVGFQVAKYRPMQEHENICVFCKTTPQYNPIMTKRSRPLKYKCGTASSVSPLAAYDNAMRISYAKYPSSIIMFTRDRDAVHPTQKPVALMSYLIRTYTNPGDTVLDNCMGSGTTGVACVQTGRDFIGIERDDRYFQMAKDRIEQEAKQITLF